jgi:hypothetical protein
MTTPPPLAKPPTIHLLDPLKLKEEVRDPALVALFEQGYVVATSIILVDGPPDQPERQVSRIALVLYVPPAPPAPPPPAVSVPWPRWLPWATGAIVALVLVSTLCDVVATVIAG